MAPIGKPKRRIKVEPVPASPGLPRREEPRPNAPRRAPAKPEREKVAKGLSPA